MCPFTVKADKTKLKNLETEKNLKKFKDLNIFKGNKTKNFKNLLRITKKT